MNRLHAVVWISWAGLVAGMDVPQAGSAQQPRLVVESVEFEGVSQDSRALVRRLVRTEPGAVLDRSVIAQDVARLLRSGRFLHVSHRIDESGDRASVVFVVAEPSVVRSIQFEGNDDVSDRTLEKKLLFKKGDTVDMFAIRDGRDAIVAEYRAKGYADVEVTLDEDRVMDSGEVVYSIREGTQSRIEEIRFDGAVSIDHRELRRRIRTRTYMPIFRSGAFDPEAAARDAASLQQYYRDRGFLDARASYRQELSAQGERITLVFSIDEGTRYVVNEIAIEGNTVYSTEELRRLMGTDEGEFVDRVQLETDRRAVQRHYAEYGYIYARAFAETVFAEDPGLVIVRIRVDEDDQFRVGKVLVRGNTRTKDRVVRRALNLYPPDDLFNMTEAEAAEDRLRQTQLFDSVRIVPTGSQPGVRDVLIDVQETDKAGDVLFSLGVTSNSGVIGALIFDFNNFDISDTPRNFAELQSFRAFQGAGQRLRIELQPGTQVNRYRIDFTEPYFFGRPLRFTSSSYLFQRGRDGYDEQRIGQSFSLGKRFERGRLAGWAGELALRFESVRVDDVDLFASSEIRDDEGRNTLTSLRGTLLRDRTDNRFLPTKGDRLQFSYEQYGVLGGDVYGRAIASYSWHTRVHTDVLDRPSVFSVGTEIGAMFGDAPVYERFYAGGVGSMRGFAFRGIGEHDGIDDNNIGGDSLLTISGEYSFPLYGDNVRGLVFLDTGTVEDGLGFGKWRAAAGAGVRLVIDLLGPLPMEFAVGVPVLSESDDTEQVFSFSIGRAF